MQVSSVKKALDRTSSLGLPSPSSSLPDTAQGAACGFRGPETRRSLEALAPHNDSPASL